MTNWRCPRSVGRPGKPFVMVVRRKGRGALELIRAVAIDPAPSVSDVPVRLADTRPDNLEFLWPVWA